MRRLPRLSVLLVIVAALSCATHPRTIKQYSKDGISFSHYSDWRITQDGPIEEDPNTRSIYLEGPDEAIVMFICMHPMISMSAAEFAESYGSELVERIEEKYKAGPIKPFDVTPPKSSPTVGRIAGQESEGVILRFSIKVFGQAVPHETRIYAVDSPRYRIYILTQVATEDLPRTTPAFNVTLNSFLVAEDK